MALRAGAAVVEITPRSPSFLAGYASRDHAHEGVHDPLMLRALYVEGRPAKGKKGEVREALLVSGDLLWFREDVLGGIVAAVEEHLGIPAERVMMAGTHTHSAPTTSGSNLNPEWVHALEAKVVAAAALAKTRVEAVTLKTARGESGIGVNRREQKPSGEVVLGYNPDGPIDREMILLSFEGEGGTIARVANFACHGVVLGPRNFLISGDWCGMAAASLEKSAKGAPFLFLNGGAANVNPRLRSGPQSSFEPVEDLANEFVADAKKAARKLKAIEADDVVDGVHMMIHLPRKQRDIDEGMGKMRKIRLHGLRIGPLRVVSFPGEVFSETTMAVKEALAPGLAMVCSYTSGGAAGYVPVSEAYDTGGYEVRVSPYSEEAEVALVDGFLALAEKMQ